MSTQKVRGLYFNQFEIGMQITTQGRTITESDIVGFAGLSGDYNQIHTDKTYASKADFGKRVAHGLLVTSIVSGLAVQTGFMEGTVMAFREISQWKYSSPIFIGDTIHAKICVANKKAMKRINAGSVDLEITVYNQDDKIVQSGNWIILIKNQN
tara:strand:+ start:133 stop:594 length:462 start_codon:yes stop_codon:yes gene_type:complete